MIDACATRIIQTFLFFNTEKKNLIFDFSILGKCQNSQLLNMIFQSILMVNTFI